MKNKLTILGIGNRLMMDDGIGIYIVEALKKEEKRENINYMIGESDIDYCLDIVMNSDYTIIIDAIMTGNEIGNITIIPFSNLLTTKLNISPHNDHLFFSISQDKHINGLVIGIDIDHIAYQYGLSSELENKFPSILKEVNKFIHSIIIEITSSI